MAREDWERVLYTGVWQPWVRCRYCRTLRIFYSETTDKTFADWADELVCECRREER